MRMHPQLPLIPDARQQPPPPERLAGVDEAGRGPLAGPVVAAAVILPTDVDPLLFAGICDSKMLSAETRDLYFDRIREHALAYGIAHCSAREIEQLNIRRASLTAMTRAVEQLTIQPDYVMVDGRDYLEIPIPGEAVIKGDQKVLSISAASILAKVTRDRMMDELHTKYPLYGFHQHKGYPTKFHQTAVRLFGPCIEHRQTYAGVKNLPAPSTSTRFAEYLKQVEQYAYREELERLAEQVQSAGLVEDEMVYLASRIKERLSARKQKERKARPKTVDKGSRAEQAMIEFLTKQGYTLMERNFKGRNGEIDLIVFKEDVLVFAEVKFRRSREYGMPYEAVTPKKQRAMVQTAEEYMYKKKIYDKYSIRYDILSIHAPPGRPAEVQHIPDAFRVEEELM